MPKDEHRKLFTKCSPYSKTIESESILPNRIKVQAHGKCSREDILVKMFNGTLVVV